ncbi:polysaccharide export protein [Qipengyuania sp. GH38]|uniref:polysaccharide biosynthesis/export family protein n=1 Tax=Qipengyuania intermedia TaxID=2867244 RepID=UPI001C86E641|nr:polysaccharide biosynthesis/export family protein [Qipengyuania intermedia]MBX7515086.1 polysaccharide export protein [Qipengyuania intermedia]
MSYLVRLTCVAALFSLGGCFSPSAGLPKDEAAYAVMPPAEAGGGMNLYRIGVLDSLSIRVFQEPELSFETVSVDASGFINFPLVGQIEAVGKTPQQLSDELEAGLGSRFIRDPQVVVGVVESAAQRVTVTGSVVEPGVYEIAGASSLVESIARAKGLTDRAVDDEVLIFREIDGERYGAVFNLRHIQEGRAPDPQILGGDRIVVGYSTVRGAYQDFLRAAPILNVFSRF